MTNAPASTRTEPPLSTAHGDTASGRRDHGNAAWRLVEELFVIPDGEKFLLYAPLRGSVAVVNSSVVKALQEVHAGTRRLDPGLPFFHELVQVGIAVPAESAVISMPPPHVDRAFDPHGVSLFLTTECSMRCTYCYASAGDRASMMPWEVAKAAIDWIADHVQRRGRRDFYVMFHGGGEVMIAASLAKRCVAYVRSLASEKALSVSIEAGLNGVTNPAMADWVLENVDGATVSLDGTPEIHDAQRPLTNGDGSFELVARTLRRMDEAHFRYGLRITVTPESLAALPSSVRYICRTFGARVIQAEPVFDVGRAAANHIPAIEPQAFVNAFRAARTIARKFGRELRYSGARLSGGSTFCKVAGESFAVNPEGLVTSCYEVSSADDPRSSLFIYGRFDRVSGRFEFDDERLRRLRTLTVQHKPQCQGCFCKWHCAGDCSAKLAQLGDAWDASRSPRCHMNRELTKDLILQELLPSCCAKGV
jgi:uncharacterized protein